MLNFKVWPVPCSTLVRGTLYSAKLNYNILSLANDRLATGLGLSITSAIATSITSQQLSKGQSEKDSLLAGYKSAGWVCTGSATIALLISVVFCRNMGIVGGKIENGSTAPEGTVNEIELTQTSNSRGST